MQRGREGPAVLRSRHWILRKLNRNDGLKRPTPIADEKLLAQYTEIARLAGGLAHEIKNPLSTIRLNMELLAEDFDEAQTPAQRRAAKRSPSCSANASGCRTCSTIF